MQCGDSHQNLELKIVVHNCGKRKKNRCFRLRLNKYALNQTLLFPQ